MNKKNRAYILFVVVFLLILLSSFTIENLTFVERFGICIIELIIYSCIFMISPLIYFKGKNNISYKTAKKFCAINSVIVIVITAILFVLSNQIGSAGWITGIIYYFINLDLFYNKNEPVINKTFPITSTDNNINELSEDELNSIIKTIEQNKKGKTIKIFLVTIISLIILILLFLFPFLFIS